jgi:ketosteroid isomerase-like protein
MGSPLLRALALFCMAASAAVAHAATDAPHELVELERASHERWLVGDLAALDALMSSHFRFVAMNGAVETKEEIVGTGEGEVRAPRALQVTTLRVEPEEVLEHGDTAVVISMMHIEATVRGRPVPERMRILSVFQRRQSEGWALIARSITPLLAPPAP